MDFAKLCEPYKENGRTPQGQIKWLTSKGIPKDKIDQAMLVVYDEIDRGKIFENGHEFDRYLLETAQGLHKASLDDEVQKLQRFFDGFKSKWGEDLTKLAQSMNQKPRLMKRIKAVFRP